MKDQKEYNEYGDKLVSIETAINAETAGFDEYQVECYTITAVKSKISEIERANLDLDHLKKVAELSYEDWVKWQNKELEV
jgi:hypothetical protein